jgi:hypothetical protein
MSKEFSVSFETSGLKSDISIPQENVDKYIQSCLHDSCVLVRNYAKNNHNFKDRTGRLNRAIRFYVFNNLQTGVVYVDTTIEDYGVYVHEPTGVYGPKHERYDIFPVRAKALSFFWKRLGEWVYLKHVSHPGSKADQFLYKALDDNKDNINKIFADGLRRLING